MGSPDIGYCLKNPDVQQIEADLSAGAQRIHKEMQIFEATKKILENSEKIYHSLDTIRQTSVEAERAFSAMGLFVTKIINRLNDDTLNVMIVIRQFYKKYKNINPFHGTVLSFVLGFFKPVTLSNSLNTFHACW